MLVPAVNALKAAGHEVHAIVTSPFDCASIFKNSDLFGSIVDLKSKRAIVTYSWQHRKRFDLVVMDQFALSKTHFWMAKRLGKNVLVQSEDVQVIAKKFVYVPLMPDIHGIKNNLNLVSSFTDDNQINYQYLPKSKKQGYAVFQPGSGNNLTPWKNWPIQHWVKVLNQIDYPIKVIGDRYEAEFIEPLVTLNNVDIEILIGKQSVSDMVDTVAKSSYYIGHDSGPMHIAVACDVPTFVIWGASPQKTYAYNELFPKSNIVIKGAAKIYEDHCINGLEVDMVTLKLKQFLREH